MITMMAEEFRRWLLELAGFYVALVALGATLIGGAAWLARTYWGNYHTHEESHSLKLR